MRFRGFGAVAALFVLSALALTGLRADIQKPASVVGFIYSKTVSDGPVPFRVQVKETPGVFIANATVAFGPGYKFTQGSAYAVRLADGSPALRMEWIDDRGNSFAATATDGRVRGSLDAVGKASQPFDARISGLNIWWVEGGKQVESLSPEAVAALPALR